VLAGFLLRTAGQEGFTPWKIKGRSLGPIDDVPERDPEKVAGLPAAVRKYFRSLNTRKISFDFPNRPDNMARRAPGISTGRWS
jgi:hypothetical protein